MIDMNSKLTRRTLIRSMSAAGGMIVGFQVPGALAAVIAPKPWTTPTDGAEINAWLAIDTGWPWSHGAQPLWLWVQHSWL